MRTELTPTKYEMPPAFFPIIPARRSNASTEREPTMMR
jgi:hypothetical protein